MKVPGGKVVMQREVLSLSRWTIGGGRVVLWLKEPTWEARLLKVFQRGQEVSARMRLCSKWWRERLGNWREPTCQAKQIREPTYSTWVHWLIASAVEDNRCSLQCQRFWVPVKVPVVKLGWRTALEIRDAAGKLPCPPHQSFIYINLQVHGKGQ